MPDCPYLFAARLAVLRRQNAWLKRSVALLALLAVGGLALATQGRNEAVTARRIDLVDGDGKSRVVLRGEAAGGAVELFNDKGKPRLRFEVNGDRRQVVTFDETGNERVRIAVTGSVAELSLLDGREKVYAGWAVERAGPRAFLGGSPDKPFTELGLDQGQPRLLLRDETGNERARLAAGRGSQLFFQDANARPRVNWTVSGADAALMLSDEDGRQRLSAGMTRDAFGLWLHDAAGRAPAGLVATRATGDVTLTGDGAPAAAAQQAQSAPAVTPNGTPAQTTRPKTKWEYLQDPSRTGPAGGKSPKKTPAMPTPLPAVPRR